MKRLFTLIVLLGLAVGVVTGCNQSSDQSNAPANTNAAPAAPGTNQ